jgi:putative ABC transport system permease protein
MNVINRVTFRQLMLNKRRTLVTVIGVIISAAMITAVTTIGVSSMDLVQRQFIAEYGEWHVVYEDVTLDQAKGILQDENTKTLILSKDRGYVWLEGSRNRNKPYLFITQYNTAGFENLPIVLSSGRFPENENEVVISEEVVTNAKVNYRLGERIILSVGQRRLSGFNNTFLDQNKSLMSIDGKPAEILINQEEVTYTVVGTIKRPTWEPTWAPGYTVIGFIDDKRTDTEEAFNVSVALKKVNRSVYAHAKEVAEELGISSFSFNNSLLRLYGVTDQENWLQTLYWLVGIILTITVIGSVSLIYNAFAISVSERSRHLGMLSSVGATKKQNRMSVFFEGMVIGLISIPLGVISGLAGLGITFYYINSLIQGALGISERLMVKVTPLSILAACLVSIVTIFISSYIPARKVSKITAIDAIRQTTDIKLTKKSVKTSRLIRKLFGIEAEIGLKNLKRYKRRYQATVFSIVISIVLFLTVSFYTSYLAKSLELTQSGYNYDIEVRISEGAENSKQMADSIISRDEVTAHTVIQETDAYSWIDEDLVGNKLRQQLNQYPIMEGKYFYSLQIYALDDESLKAYAKEVGADYDRLIDLKQPAGIVIGNTTYRDSATNRFIDAKSIEAEVGDSLGIYAALDEFSKEEHLIEMEIAALTDVIPMGVVQARPGALSIIISRQTLDNLGIDNASKTTKLYLNSTDPMATQYSIEEMESSLFVYNIYQLRQQEEQMILIMSVFTYGFITLISLICIANIFNTISTSIALRQREFAMLKSVGMTPESFNKMINYESIFYGFKALGYGLPLSLLIMFWIYRSLMGSFSYEFVLPWGSILIAVTVVFVIVSSSMLYAGSKINKANIIDTLKREIV